MWRHSTSAPAQAAGEASMWARQTSPLQAPAETERHSERGVAASYAGANIERQRALILTSRTGGGHVSLAQALGERLAPRYAVTIADPHPASFHSHYRLVSRHAPWLWFAEFQALNTPWRSRQADRFLTRLVVRRLEDLLDRARPDIVLSTHPLLTQEASHVLERRAPHVPFALLFADPLDLHALWLSERGSATFAPTRETYQQAFGAGFDPARLHLTGWPVRAQFFQAAQMSPTSRAETIARLGLAPDRFTVFLQGGGEGAARFARTVATVLAADPAIQIVLACGTNTALLARYSGAPRVAALPFTREIAPFMAAADVVMGKAGPNTLFEAVTLGKPFLATAYLPGHEAANLRFIRRHGLGWVALRPEEQRALLAALVENPRLLAAKAETVNAYRAWNAAATETILPVVEALTTPADAQRSHA